MVDHKAVGVTDQFAAFIDVLRGVQEVLAVRVVLESSLLLVPAGGHMIDCTRVFNAERTGHGGTLTENWQKGKKGDLTL